MSSSDQNVESFAIEKVVDTVPNTTAPADIDYILDQLSNDDLKNSVKKFICNKENELCQSKLCFEEAQREVTETKERLNELETELSNIRSATALFVADQDDAFSTLKRKHAEEIASILELTRRGLLNVSADDSHNTEVSHTVDEGVSPSAAIDNDASFQTNGKFTPQSLANHALDKVEKVVKRVSLKSLANNFSLNKLNLPSLTGSNLTADGKERLEHIIETYKWEINKLKQILDNSNIQSNSSNPPRATSDCPELCDTPLTTSNSLGFQADHTDANCLNMALNPQSVVDSYSSRTLSNKDVKAQHTKDGIEFEELKHKYNQLEVDYQSQSITLQVGNMRLTELENELKVEALNNRKRIQQLETMCEQLLRRLDGYLTNYKMYRNDTEDEIQQLKKERIVAQKDLDLLRSHYDALVGRRTVAAVELSAQPIHLPFDKSDLELLALKLYEENISFREAREHLDDRLRSQTQFHRQQMLAEQQQRSTLESTLRQELEEARKRLVSFANTAALLETEVDLRQKFEEEAKQMKLKLQDLEEKYEQTESEANEYKVRSSALQQQVIRLQTDLDNVESVQADFVKLSQDLQVQLERFRQEDHEVRWVNPEDVTHCFACNSSFPTGPLTSSRKINCRHCGKVHCAHCMKHTVPSGPLGNAASVCDICHTLLNKNVAPYFSTNEFINQRKQSNSPKRFSTGTGSVLT